MRTLKKISLLIDTLRYLKFKQIYYQIFYRLRKILKAEAGKFRPHPEKTTDLKLEAYIPKPKSYANNTFTFLNLVKDYPSVAAIHWDEPVYGKLWTYNLNYFDFLLQPGMDTGTGNQLIDDFLKKYSTLKNAIEPYTISLRGINWIKWFSLQENFRIPKKKEIDKALWEQYQQLLSNIEYHLLGNHLLENGFSLLFGAYYFHDTTLYRKAKKILLHELNEQVLADGAHFELSPMYHQLMLDRVLDCINLLQHNRRFDDQDHLLTFLKEKAGSMLGWLNQVSFSNGEIPMVNDAAAGIAPATGELLAYAGRLKVSVTGVKLSQSGYRMFRHPAYELFADLGQPGPDYIPGHAHADIFNFVVNVYQKPFIADTGTSTYIAGSRRSEERSTSAHNTVMVDAQEQSEMWSAFRMGRRSKPVIITDESDRCGGYYKTKGYIHWREFYTTSGSITLIDRVSGKYKEAVAYFHIYPGTVVRMDKGKVFTDVFSFEFSGATSVSIEKYFFSGGFNYLVEAPLVKVVFYDQLKTQMRINKHD